VDPGLAVDPGDYDALDPPRSPDPTAVTGDIFRVLAACVVPVTAVGLAAFVLLTVLAAFVLLTAF
jgi:hypothetical protein